MARPIDPTSRLQVEKRAKRLRSEESGWTRSLCLGIAMAALKAWQWNHYLENGGEPGPLAGTFPKLPEEPGAWVVVGAHPPKEGERFPSRVMWQTEKPGEPDIPFRALWGVGLGTLEGNSQSRLHLFHENQWLEDGQTEGCEVPDREQLERALGLAGLLQEKHLLPHLRPAFYQEVALWIGELLKAPRPEPYTPSTAEGSAIWLDPQSRRIMGGETPIDGLTVLKGGPGRPWAGDLWRVAADPLGIPSDAALAHLQTSAEDVALSAAAWHFGRILYRKVLDPRPDGLGRCGLERLTLLRQLLEELEVVAPRGLPVRSLAEKPVVSMATNEVASLGLRAFPRPDKWDEHEGRGRFLHEGHDKRRRWELTMATGAGEELAYLSLAQCRRVLRYRNAGLEITSLHALLCCYLMQLKDPSSRFTVSGDDLLRDLGLEARRWGGQSRSDLLKQLGSWASLLGMAQCEGWSQPRGQERVSMDLGPMWSISIHANGQLQLLDQENPKPDTLTDLSLTVTPGTWAETQRWVTREASHVLYVPIAAEILQLGRHRRELAFRLGIHLALGFRERKQWRSGIANVPVGQLLRDVLPEGDLERARQNRDEGMKLRERWNAAVATLRDAVGFSFTFPNCPPALVPPDFPGHEAGTAPRGALDMLLNSRVEIHWPEQVVEARYREPLAKVQERETRRLIRQQQARLLNQRPTDNAAKLKAAREASGLTQRAAAPLLGMSAGQLGRLEVGSRPLPEPELRRCVALLETVKRRGRG